MKLEIRLEKLEAQAAPQGQTDAERALTCGCGRDYLARAISVLRFGVSFGANAAKSV
jgi:hypothetical protein